MSHLVLQQYASPAHTVVTQESHPFVSLVPEVHAECAHVPPLELLAEVELLEDALALVDDALVEDEALVDEVDEALDDALEELLDSAVARGVARGAEAVDEGRVRGVGVARAWAGSPT